MFENSDSFRDYVYLRRYGINPGMTITPDSKTTITLSYEHFHDRRTADRGIPSFQGRPADTPIFTFFGDPNNSYVSARVDLASALMVRQIGRLTIRNRTLVGDYDRGYQNFVPGAVNTTETLVSLSGASVIEKAPFRSVTTERVECSPCTVILAPAIAARSGSNIFP